MTVAVVSAGFIVTDVRDNCPLQPVTSEHSGALIVNVTEVRANVVLLAFTLPPLSMLTLPPLASPQSTVKT